MIKSGDVSTLKAGDVLQVSVLLQDPDNDEEYTDEFVYDYSVLHFVHSALDSCVIQEPIRSILEAVSDSDSETEPVPILCRLRVEKISRLVMENGNLEFEAEAMVLGKSLGFVSQNRRVTLRVEEEKIIAEVT